MIRALTLAVTLFLLVAPAGAMTKQVAGDQVIMSGTVERYDVDQLDALLKQNPGIRTIVLRDSPGGDGFAMRRLMYLIRTSGLRTVVSGYCTSACAYVFISGVERHLASEAQSKTTYLAFHGAYGSNSGRFMVESVYHAIEDIVTYTDGKADRALFKRMIEIGGSNGAILIEDPIHRQRPHGTSVWLCPNGLRGCERIPGTDGFAQGIFTSRELIPVNGVAAASPPRH